MSSAEQRRGKRRARESQLVRRDDFWRGFDTRRPSTRIDFTEVALAALPNLPLIVARWLPDGKRQGSEWVARNPTRTDRNIGSFKVNLRTGRWGDFATGQKGGDVISLGAHLFGLTQVDAARSVAKMLGLSEGGGK